jgi:hypothetical protein
LKPFGPQRTGASSISNSVSAPRITLQGEPDVAE